MTYTFMLSFVSALEVSTNRQIISALFVLMASILCKKIKPRVMSVLKMLFAMRDIRSQSMPVTGDKM